MHPTANQRAPLMQDLAVTALCARRVMPGVKPPRATFAEVAVDSYEYECPCRQFPESEKQS